MEVNELLNIGNITTIVVWIVNIILPYVASYGLDRDVLTSLIFTVLWFAFTVYSSANPNSFKFLGNELKDKALNMETEETIMNDEYEIKADEEGC